MVSSLTHILSLSHFINSSMHLTMKADKHSKFGCVQLIVEYGQDLVATDLFHFCKFVEIGWLMMDGTVVAMDADVHLFGIWAKDLANSLTHSIHANWVIDGGWYCYCNGWWCTFIWDLCKWLRDWMLVMTPLLHWMMMMMYILWGILSKVLGTRSIFANLCKWSDWLWTTQLVRWMML